MKQSRKSVLICTGVGVVITVLVLTLELSREYGVLRSLCDGLFTAAIMLLGVGGIIWVSNKGLFDAMGYGIRSVFRVHLPGVYDLRERETYSDYVERKEKSRKSPNALLISGSGYLAASVLTLVLYYLV